MHQNPMSPSENNNPGEAGSVPGRTDIFFEFESDLCQRATQVLHFLSTVNDPPFLFQKGRNLVRITRERGYPIIEPLTKVSLRTELTQRARFYEQRFFKNRPEFVGCDLSLDLTEYLLSLDSWPFPELDRVVSSPIFTRDGQLVADDGYHASERLLLRASACSLPQVPHRPTPEHVTQARTLILDELLVDFPFRDEASRAHAVAMGLLPFVRLMIGGPTPLHLISAPVQGTGKSLLAEAMSVIATGASPKMITEAQHDEEWRKRITAMLDLSPTYIVIDNINRPIDSAALAAVITVRDWGDRRLGKSTMMVAQNNSTWVATANNPTMSGEIARRTLWLHLDPLQEHPWLRSGFKHASLLTWVEQNRSQLMWAFLVLTQNWVARGMPSPLIKKPFGSFEQWTRVVAGILESANIEGFLENMGDSYERADEDSNEWRVFVEAWWQELGDRPVRAAQLNELARERGLLPSLLDELPFQKRKTALGNALRSKRDRVFEGLKLVHGGQHTHLKVSQYRLTNLNHKAGIAHK
ncbi:hypothetical protein D3C72_699780 [compost metagenome]